MKRFNWLLIGSVVLCLVMVLQVGCGVSKSECEALQAQNTVLITQNESLKVDYDVVKADYEAAKEELAEIKEVYPLKYFDNYNQLEDWVDEHCPITNSGYDILKEHLGLQEKALADGYIWSVYTQPDGIGIVSCVVAGYNVYYVWLDGYIEWASWKEGRCDICAFFPLERRGGKVSKQPL